MCACLNSLQPIQQGSTDTAFEIQVLIPQPFMGTIIGTGGTKIKELRSVSGWVWTGAGGRWGVREWGIGEQLHCVGDECGSDFVSVMLGGELVHCVSVTYKVATCMTNIPWYHLRKLGQVSRYSVSPCPTLTNVASRLLAPRNRSLNVSSISWTRSVRYVHYVMISAQQVRTCHYVFCASFALQKEPREAIYLYEPTAESDMFPGPPPPGGDFPPPRRGGRNFRGGRDGGRQGFRGGGGRGRNGSDRGRG